MAYSKKKLESLKKDASLALSGAEYVREKLISLSGIGSRTLFDKAYAIKFRVKSLDSLVNKVIDKHKEKPHYCCSDATDLVGMRLLVLYASELPTMCKHVVNFIRFCQNPDIGLMKGTSLDDAILEVKVFKSDQNQRVYDSVYKYFYNLPFNRNGNSIDKVTSETYTGDEKSYSSIHIVCSCLSYASGSAKIVPLEIQIRTIFEDTWGEIDHELEYKFNQKVKGRIPAKIKASHANYRSTLHNIKGLLEQAGHFAENVKAGYEQIYDAVGLKQIAKKEPFQLHPRYHAEPYENHIDLKGNFSKDNIKKIEKISKDTEELRSAFIKNNIQNGEYKSIISKIENYISSIDDFIDLNSNLFEDLNNFEIYYFLRMEKAISFVWKGLVLSHFDPQDVFENSTNFEKAKQIYFDMEKDASLRDDPFLNFRLAIVLLELGQDSVAEFFLSQSATQFKTSPRIISPQFRVEIPHSYGFNLWKKRSRILEMGFKSGNPRINREDQLHIMLEAVYYTLVSFDEYHSLKQHFDNKQTETELKFANNLICYFWEIRDLSRSRQEFEEVIEALFDELNDFGFNLKIDLEIFGKVIDEAVTTDHTSSRFNDTLMKFYHLSGNVDKLALHRSKILDKLEKNTDSLNHVEADHEYIRYSIERTSGREGKYKVALRLN